MLCIPVLAVAVVGAALTGAAMASPAQGVDVAEVAALSTQLLEALSSAGLVGRGEAVAPFTWTLEIRRPARAPRQVREQFSGTPPGAPVGLSPVVRETLGPKPRPPRPGVSVRALTVVHPGDVDLDVRIEGLVLPLEPGARFRLDYDEDHSSLSQTCVVGAPRPASGVHPAIPGSARSIECSGRGSYHGIPVQVFATMLYFARLGVFLNLEQRIDSPVGRLRGGTRVLNFEMAAR